MTTDVQRSRSARPLNRPRSRQDLIWKSGILAASAGATLLGWALLRQPTAAPVAAAQVQPPPPRVVVVQIPVVSFAGGGLPGGAGIGSLDRGIVDRSDTGAGASHPALTLPTMPRRPVFRAPVTRTRRS